MKKAKSLILEALRIAANDEALAVAFFEKQRWGETPACPRCGDVEVYAMKGRDGQRNKDYRWRCRGCSSLFTVRTGTILEETRLPLTIWATAIWKACASKKGISALQLSRETEITHKSAAVAASHKFRGYSYMNPCHAGQRYMRFQGVDREIAIMGDIHTPAFMHYYDGPKERLSLVAGSLNTDSMYANRYFSIFTQPHYPCLLLDQQAHQFTPFKNLAAWKRYARA